MKILQSLFGVKYIYVLTLLLILPNTLFAQLVTEEPCWAAIWGTGAHYSIGDGSGEGVEVEYWGSDPIAVGLASTLDNGDSIVCFLAGENCPDFPEEGVDPHNYPGVASCAGCQDQSGNNPAITSINEAKCCLKWGYTTPPPGESC